MTTLAEGIHMNFIDHPVLYSYNGCDEDWRRLVIDSELSNNSFWRRYARRKMRRSVKQLLVGTRPRISMGWAA